MCKYDGMFSFSANGAKLPVVQSERVAVLGKPKSLCQVSVQQQIQEVMSLQSIECLLCGSHYGYINCHLSLAHEGLFNNWKDNQQNHRSEKNLTSLNGMQNYISRKRS